MKKIYQHPTSRTIVLQVRNAILVGSIKDDVVDEGESGLVFTRRRMWEDEEEDY